MLNDDKGLIRGCDRPDHFKLRKCKNEFVCCSIKTRGEMGFAYNEGTLHGTVD